MIVIIDYGMGNLGSVLNMFKKIGVAAMISSDLDVIDKAPKLLLPGVGSFNSAMKRINDSGMLGVLNQKVLVEKIPVLGICLGMQLLTNFSEEGKLSGLCWIDAETLRFPNNSSLKIPHMGWNRVLEATPSELTKNLPSEARFYFVHSYYVKVRDEADSILKCTHGIEFDAAIQHENIYGAQFHPEKSHKFGMRLFNNFAKI
jgi:glutamine amidotransferase